MPPSTRASRFAEPPRGPNAGASGRGARRAGAACVALVLGAALLGPAIAPYDPFSIAGEALAPPDATHPMGTDALGRDVLSAVLSGARTSLLVATGVSLVALAIGTVVGLLAGYRGGWVDDVLMRVSELLQVVPRFFLAIVAIAFLGPGLDRLILVIGLTAWPLLARVVRGEVLAMRELDFVHASVALGASPGHLLWHQLLPNLAPTIRVMTCVLFGQALLLEATLGFLGLASPDSISWGVLAAQAQSYLRVAWWLALFPGAAISIAVVGVNLLGDSWAADSARY